jgi:hypothetical protein
VEVKFGSRRKVKAKFFESFERKTIFKCFSQISLCCWYSERQILKAFCRDQSLYWQQEKKRDVRIFWNKKMWNA